MLDIRLSIKHYACSIAIINLDESFDVFTVKRSQWILDSIESSDVSRTITTDIGRLMIHKQQSIQFCYETELKRTHTTLNDKLN